MSQYPEVITSVMLRQQAHISDAEIRADMVDTEREIRELEQRWEADKLLQSIDRMASFRVGTYAQRIIERQAFVAFLQRLEASRKAVKEAAHESA